jgi:hypothetical protein
MKNIKIILCSLMLLSFVQDGLSQSRKHLFEISTSGNYGFGYFFSGSIRTYDSTGYQERESQSNLRINFRYTYLVNRRLGFGLSFSHQRFNNFYSQTDNSVIAMNSLLSLSYQESMSFDMLSSMLTVKYANNRALIPFGIEHTWGVGPAFYSLVDKTYATRYKVSDPNLSFYDFNSYDIDFKADEEVFNFQRYRGLNIFYNIDLNFPITPSQFFSVGFEFYGNYVFLKKEFNYPDVNDNATMDDWVPWLYFRQNQDGALTRRMVSAIVWVKLGYKFLL